MKDRRNFLKGAGIISAFVVGAASYKQVQEIAEANRDISHLAPPEGATTLQITGNYGKPVTPPITATNEYGMYSFAPMYSTPTNSVTMTVGKDDRLWIKINEEWKRVAIEG
jgi:hypothetical protein